MLFMKKFTPDDFRLSDLSLYYAISSNERVSDRSRDFSLDIKESMSLFLLVFLELYL